MKTENPKEAGLDEDRSSYIRLRKVIKLKEYDLVRYRGKLLKSDGVTVCSVFYIGPRQLYIVTPK